MFEVGRDIFKHGFTGASGNALGHKRLRFVYGFFVAIFIVFVGRTFQLAIQGTDRVRQGYGDGAWIVNRADIIDRNGDILAKNVMSGHVTLRPKQVKDDDAVAQLIHDIFPYDYSVSDVLKILNSGRNFYYIKKYASDSADCIGKTFRIGYRGCTRAQIPKTPFVFTCCWICRK